MGCVPQKEVRLTYIHKLLSLSVLFGPCILLSFTLCHPLIPLTPPSLWWGMQRCQTPESSTGPGHLKQPNQILWRYWNVNPSTLTPPLCLSHSDTHTHRARKHPETIVKTLGLCWATIESVFWCKRAAIYQKQSCPNSDLREDVTQICLLFVWVLFRYTVLNVVWGTLKNYCVMGNSKDLNEAHTHSCSRWSYLSNRKYGQKKVTHPWWQKLWQIIGVGMPSDFFQFINSHWFNLGEKNNASTDV